MSSRYAEVCSMRHPSRKKRQAIELEDKFLYPRRLLRYTVQVNKLEYQNLKKLLPPVNILRKYAFELIHTRIREHMTQNTRYEVQLTILLMDKWSCKLNRNKYLIFVTYLPVIKVTLELMCHYWA